MGSFLDLIGPRVIATMERARAEYGDVASFSVGPRRLIVVSSPAVAREVLVDRARDLPRIYGGTTRHEGLALALGTGILTNPDFRSWLEHRRVMQPKFHRRQLAGMVDSIAAAGESMLDRWDRSYEPEDTLDLHEEMMHVALDAASRALFGSELVGKAVGVEPAVARAARYTYSRLMNPFRLPPWVPTRTNRRFAEAVATIDSVVLGVVRERREDLAAGLLPRGDLLDMLLGARDAETGEGMADQELVDEVKTMLVAGHETTAASLSWSLYLLARHPEELRRVRDEPGPNGNDPLAPSYTRQVFSEAMRLYPPVPVMGRIAARATSLGGFAVPAGAHVLVNVYNIHRHPDLWEEPERFDPDRFAPERAMPRPRLAYMPFGAGWHKCVGMHLALVEGPLLLSMIAKSYDWTPVPGLRVDPPELAITLVPRGGLRGTLSPHAEGERNMARVVSGGG